METKNWGTKELFNAEQHKNMGNKLFETEQDTEVNETSCSSFSMADTNRAAIANGVHAPDNMDFASSPQTATSSETSILDPQECSANTWREARRTPTSVIDADRRPAHTHRRSTVRTARRGKPFVCKLIVFQTICL